MLLIVFLHELVSVDVEKLSDPMVKERVRGNNCKQGHE
jgi:hypothetical protein